MTQQINNVSDLIEDLCQRFSDKAAEVKAWTDEFFFTLGKLPPAELRQVRHETLKAWRYKSPPKPADFAAHLRKSSAYTSVSLDAQERLRTALQKGVESGRLTESEAQKVWSETCQLPGYVIERRGTEAA